MDKWFHPTLFRACDYLSMLGLKLNLVLEGSAGINILRWRKLPNLLSNIASFIERKIDSIWSSDAKRSHKSWSILVQVMVWYLILPNHSQNQYWLITDEVLWQSPEGNSTGNSQGSRYEVANFCFNIAAISSRSQRLKLILFPASTLSVRSAKLVSYVLWYIHCV